MQITVDVKGLAKNDLFFNEEFGSGEFDGEKFTATHALPSKSIIIEYREKRYMVDSQAIIRAVLEQAHAEGEKS